MTAVADPATVFGAGTGAAPQRPRVLVGGESEALHRTRVMGVIEARQLFDVCGTADTGWEIIERARELKPDLLVVDISNAELNASEVVRQVKRDVATAEVLVLSPRRSAELIFEMLEAGANSFLVYEEASRHLTAALESLAGHKPFLTPDVAEIVLARALGQQPELPSAPAESRLTSREAQTLRLLADGSSNKDVAAALGISVRTAETHRATLMRKLGLDSIAALVRYAVRNKIVDP